MVSDEAWDAAARALDVPARLRQVVRPSFPRWLWYAFWGSLPERNAGWVLYDNTCSTWIPRHIARMLVVLVLPVLALVLLLPAPAGLRALTAAVTAGCALLFAGLYTNESGEHRLLQAGFPWGLAEALRSSRAQAAQRMGNARRRDRTAARTGRRR